MKSFNSIFFVLFLLALISTPTLALPSTPKRLQSRAPTLQEVSDTIAAWTSDINDQNKYITQIPDATKIPDRTDRDIAVSNLIVEVENLQFNQSQHLATLRSAILDPGNPRSLTVDKINTEFLSNATFAFLNGGVWDVNPPKQVKKEDSVFARVERVKNDPAGAKVLETVKALQIDRNFLIRSFVFPLMRIAQVVSDPSLPFFNIPLIPVE